MTGALCSDSRPVSRTTFFFFVCVKLAKASCCGWLVAKSPDPNATISPPPPKVQFQTPPILKRSETYNGNFQGLYAQERAPTRPTNPHQHRHPAQNPSSFLPPSPFSPAFSLESKGSESSWKVKYSLWALSSKLSQTPTPPTPLTPTLAVWNLPQTPSPSLKRRSARECRKVHLYVRYKQQRDREENVEDYAVWQINCSAVVNCRFKCM